MLEGILGAEGSTNVQGEEQQKLDVIKNLRQNKETPTTYLSEIARLIPKKVASNSFTDGITPLALTYNGSLRSDSEILGSSSSGVKNEMVSFPSLKTSQSS